MTGEYYRELVQALARPERERYVKSLIDPACGEENLLELCERWGVEPVIEYPTDGRRAYYSMGNTLHKLAEYAVSREENDDAVLDAGGRTAGGGDGNESKGVVA